MSQAIDLTGLRLAPSQVWGAVRLVPLLRADVRHDLRLGLRGYGGRWSAIHPPSAPRCDAAVVAGRRARYWSFVPHGLVVSWSRDGLPVAAFGTELKDPDGQTLDLGGLRVQLLRRMVQREDSSRLRLLPLHLAMEGFLAFQFGGPDIAWREYSARAIRHGLEVRHETSISGRSLPWLAAALRLFEIHDDQSGVLVFVADALASAFVVPSPADYRGLHRSLIEDFYGELLWSYALMYPGPSPMAASMVAPARPTLAELRAGLVGMRAEWAQFLASAASGILERTALATTRYEFGPFHLDLFRSDLDPEQENHIGELIRRDDGTLEYLKTFRLSAAQTRRAYLLGKLAESSWNLDQAAATLGATREELTLRLENAGFGYLLRGDVLTAARKGARRGKRRENLR